MSTLPNYDALAYEAALLSGPLKIPGGGIYSSYNHPRFTITKGRNTTNRLRQFQIASDLTDKTVLDLGSNTGAVAVELACRGACVIGVEINKERVDFCNKLAKSLGMNGKFYQADLRNGLPRQLAGRRFDIVCALAIDGYMEPAKLYHMLGDITVETCYLESNYPASTSADTNAEVSRVKQLMPSTFKTVRYVGCSTPHGRRMFVASKVPHQMHRSSSYLGENDWYIRYFTCYDEWDELRILTARLAGMAHVPEFDFSVPYQMKTKRVPGVNWFKADQQYLPKWRKQLVAFVRELNHRGLAHRDLHIMNLVFDKSKLWVIDWEYLCENPVPLDKCYDLTGQNCGFPGFSRINGPQHIFSTHKILVIGDYFGMKMSDFIGADKIMLS